MDAELWRRAADVFRRAVALPPENRSAFLADACGDDSALRVEVEKLLAADLPSTEFLQPPAQANVKDHLPASARDTNIGRRIGHYELKKRIGSGGYGDVYLAARRDDLKLYVALKLIKPGQHTRDVIERFTRERELLAALRHPNIAHLIDAGTTDDNLPYFVMEYIEGKPIDEYCDEHKLPIAERLKLFQQVCAAVQFAHNNLVVHRDLKPSNILVTADGVPKLVDFGIAKFLHPTLGPATMTLTEARPMTPAYASPEQVKGERITTATDVYSLGVVLYELLTGHRPYSLTTRLHQEMVRIICEEQPVKPSEMVSRQTTEEFLDPQSGTPRTRTITPHDVSRTREGEPKSLRRRLAGDVDSIVLYALRKDPKRRYGYVRQMSDDVQALLTDCPLLIARPESKMYVVRKKLKRHRTFAILVAAVLFALTTGLAMGARLQGHMRRFIIDLSSATSKQEPKSSTLPIGSMASQIHISSSSNGMILSLADDVSIDFVKIPEGEFWMGSPDTEWGRGDDEAQQLIPMHSYYIASHETTQAQWQAIMGNNPSEVAGAPNLPVENVTWEQSHWFCRKLADRCKKKVRLPTEAEWEYACRAGTTSMYSSNGKFFNGIGKADRYPPERYGLGCKCVGSFLPNAWGLYDMHGNVAEWCLDYYRKRYCADCGTPANIDEGEVSRYRVLRGGSWRDTENDCRSASRLRIPGDMRGSSIGFRMVIEENDGL